MRQEEKEGPADFFCLPVNWYYGGQREVMAFAAAELDSSALQDG